MLRCPEISIGFVVNAIFVSIENQRLMVHHRGNVLILAAFWTKLSFVLLAIALAIGISRQRIDLFKSMAYSLFSFWDPTETGER